MECQAKPRPKHIGKNIRQVRETLGIKQETVAEKMGLSQQSVSKIEQSEEVGSDTLRKVADALGVSPEAIENFSDEAVIYNIQHNHEGAIKDVSNVSVQTYHCTFNPIDK